MQPADAVIVCPTCHQPHRPAPVGRNRKARCARCDTVLFGVKPGTAGRTLALSLAALVLYVPANIYPILSIERLGVYSESTIWEGTRTLWDNGHWGVALLVFFTSILVPLLKLMVMICLSVVRHYGGRARMKYRLYRLVHGIGRWSMLEVFLLAVMVSLVRLGQLAAIRPEPGITAFAAVVVLTLLASSSFDPAVFWKQEPHR